MWAGWGGAGFENSGPWTRISKQLIGGNADEPRKRTANGGRELGERVFPSSLPQFPLQSAAAANGGAEEAVPSIGEPPPTGEFRPKTTSQRRRTSEGSPLRSSAPSVARHPRPSVNSPMGGPGWPRFSIGHRSLGSAPIENLRASSDSGRRRASLGGVKRAKRRDPTERRAEMGGGKRGGPDNRP